MISPLFLFRAFRVFRGKNPFTTETRREIKKRKIRGNKKRKKSRDGTTIPFFSTLHSLRGQTSSPRPLSPQRLTFSAAMPQEKPE